MAHKPWSVVGPDIPEQEELKSLTLLSLSDESRYEQLYLQNMSLEHANSENIIFKECLFDGVDFSQSQFPGLDVTDCRFINCNFANVNYHTANMQRVEFINCRFTGALFSETYLRDMCFNTCKCDYMSLRFSDIKHAYFKQCIFFESEWINSNLNCLKFYECDLKRSDMSQTRFQQTDIRGCQIDGLGVTVHKLRGLTIDPLQCEHFARQLGLNII